jgi:2-keto-4-pentenoate hydratase
MHPHAPGAADERVRGVRVGLTPAGPVSTDPRDPVLGRLTAGMFHLEHLPLPAAGARPSRVEPALAFVLREELRGPGVTVADALRAVAYVLPALEFTGEDPASAAVVLGATPATPLGTDLRLAGCVLHLGGAVAATGACGVVLGSPLNAVVWAVGALAADGLALAPGDLVLTSSVTPAVPVSPGDSVSASIAGVGTVTAVLAG